MTGENISAELPWDEQIIWVGTWEQIPEDNRTENTNTGSSNASVSWSSGVTTEEEQIVEEYADDLDKLFDDLLEGE